ncbi:YunG family protein [Bradyrhizobium sp. 5.13L]
MTDPKNPLRFDPDQVQDALRKAWSLSTSSQWTANNPAAGQCSVTSLLVHELFGGDLLKTLLPIGDHFYNRGRRQEVRLHGVPVRSADRLHGYAYE